MENAGNASDVIFQQSTNAKTAAHYKILAMSSDIT